MWISTTDGVFRYNGYTFEKYDYEDGLHSVDIWYMHMDNLDRIWLMSISDGLGYIKDNEYHKVFIKGRVDSTAPSKIYPHNFLNQDSFVLFTNKVASKKNYAVLGIIISDTLAFHIANMPLNAYSFDIMDTVCAILHNDSMYTYRLMSIVNDEALQSLNPIKTRAVSDSFINMFSRTTITGTFADKYIYRTSPKEQYVYFYDPHKHHIDVFDLTSLDPQQEGVVHAYTLDSLFYILTNRNIYLLNNKLNVARKYAYASFTASKGVLNSNVTYFTENAFWGKCLGTNDQGLYINQTGETYFKKLNLDLQGYEFVNMKNDTSGYWWNVNEGKLITVSKGQLTHTLPLSNLFKVKNIIKYHGNKHVMLTNNNLLKLDENDNVSYFLHNVKEFQYNNLKEKINNEYQFPLHAIANGVEAEDNKFWWTGSGWTGLAIMNINKDSTVDMRNIAIQRYSGIAHNKFNKTTICYTSNSIDFYNAKDSSISSINEAELSAAGIYDVQKILTDESGNIIIKDYNKILIYNCKRNKLRPIFNNLNLKNCFIDLSNSRLKIAGEFGVVTCDINPNGDLSHERVYANTKNVYYQYILNAQFEKDHVLLKTDSGVYSVAINEKHLKTEFNHHAYHLVVNNDGHVCKVRNDDTINVHQLTNIIGLDIIKPSGSGELHIEYSINGSAYINSGNQLVLPDLKPDTYNEISVIAWDNTWKSTATKITCYIQPYWWQTKTARRIIFALIILAGLGIVYLIILLTKRIVNENNNRRNQRRELELKSIYSQINPHFIFNTLSTAQYFVKKNKNKEAFDHINQFSDLLRAYIKSSRNKYISIADEIENLENYLQLQLTRFEDRFKYNIHVDQSLNANAIKIPSLLLQPIVENALNHGIFHKQSSGIINISFLPDEKNANTLICIVDDDGIGRIKAREIKRASVQAINSYGTILIRELIDIFNKYEKINIAIEYIDKELPKTGTTVIISIKNYMQT